MRNRSGSAMVMAYLNIHTSSILSPHSGEARSRLRLTRENTSNTVRATLCHSNWMLP